MTLSLPKVALEQQPRLPAPLAGTALGELHAGDVEAGAGNSESPSAFRRVLLVGGRPDEVANVSAALAGRYAVDWKADAASWSDLAAHDLYDAYLLCGGDDDANLQALLSQRRLDRRGAVIVLTRQDSPSATSRTLEAGAVDSIPLADLSPRLLDRTFCHAMVRQAKSRAAEQTLARLLAERRSLDHSQTAARQLIDDFCHDIRTPLSVVGEFASLLLEDEDVPEAEEKEFLGIIADRTNELAHMVDDFIEAYRLRSDEIRFERRAIMVQEVCNQLRPELEKAAGLHKYQLRLALEEGLPPVFCDRSSMVHILRTLVEDAGRSAAEGGGITVWSAHDPDLRDVSVGVTSKAIEAADESLRREIARIRRSTQPASAETHLRMRLQLVRELAEMNFGSFGVATESRSAMVTFPQYDLDVVIARQLKLLRQARSECSALSILGIAAPAEADATGPDFGRVLSRQFRSYDLVFPVRPGLWLLCIAAPQSSLPGIIRRIEKCYGELRPGAAARIAELRTSIVGTWPITPRPSATPAPYRGARAA
jgi:signal transduction histidine kinase